MWENRELPDGARQSEADSELASEQPTETGMPESRLGRNTRRIKGADMYVSSRAWRES